MTLLDFLIGVLVLSASVFWYRVCSSRSGSSLGAVVLHARKPDLSEPPPSLHRNITGIMVNDALCKGNGER